MQKAQRIELMDEIRGLCIILMVFYHALFDLTILYSIDFFDNLFNVLSNVAPFFAAVFVIISGISCRFSKSNLKRGTLLLIVSLLLTAVTRIVTPDLTIYFGIIHMLSLSILIFTLTKPLLDKIPPFIGFIASLFLFAIMYGVQYGFIGIENIAKISLSKKLFDSLYLYCIGLPNSSFSSADYFPLIPWLFMFLAGTFIGVYVRQGKYVPAFAYKRHNSFIAFAGRHTLIVYLLHQPVLYGILLLLKKLV